MSINNKTRNSIIKNITFNDKEEKKYIETNNYYSLVDKNKIFYKENNFSFDYPISPYLNSDLQEIKNENIHFCIFKIPKVDINMPFLEYMLYKKENEELIFPQFNINLENVKKSIDDIMQIIFKNYNIKYNIEGFILQNNECYLFIKIENFEYQKYIERDNRYWFVLISEIINDRKVLNFNINNLVTELFFKNIFLIHLRDKYNKKIEIPVVLYWGGIWDKINFTITNGVERASLSTIFGPFYYFTNYYKSIKYGGWAPSFKKLNDESLYVNHENKYKNGGIRRYAVFLNKMKVVLNKKYDKPLKYIGVKDKKTDYEKKTYKYRDYKGNWTIDYDSIFKGSYIDEKIILDGPLWCIKNINSYTNVSYHKLNSDSLGDKWDENTNYYIK